MLCIGKDSAKLEASMEIKHRGTPFAASRFRLVTLTWLLSAALCVFVVENLLNPYARLTPLVARPFSRSSFLATASVALGWLLLVLGQILIGKDTKTAISKKALRLGAVTLTTILCAVWLTFGRSLAAKRPDSVAKPHSVTLQWQPSSTAGVQYNVYRTKTQGSNYIKLNDKPLSALTFTDRHVESGATYYYVTRTIDKSQKESLNSNEVKVTIPNK
jgi:hypothetical protein